MATFGDRMIAAAGTQLGVPYAWGGGTYQGPSLGIRDGGVADSFKDYLKVGFDCSGLVLYCAYVASDGTMKLPHLADLQRRLGDKVEKGQQQPGDIIAFSSNGGVSYHHIGIYIGADTLRNAPQSGEVVKDSPLSNWADEKWEIRRLGESGAAVAGSNGSTSSVSNIGSTVEGKSSNLPVYVAIGAIAILGCIIVFSTVGVGQ